jgi:predicted phage-related endonuclease
MIHSKPITDRAEWLAWRKPFVGASQVPALFGAHPYLSALKLYLEKSGMEFDNTESSVMRRGRILEPSVGCAVEDERPLWKLEPAKEFFFDAERRMSATPDFWIDGDPRGRGILQAKTAAPSVYARDWQDGGIVPLWILLQATTEMLLTDAAFGAVAVMCVNNFDLVCSVHEIERHEAAEAKIIAAVERFWRDVEEGNEPPPDYGKDKDLLALLAPRESTPELVVDANGNNELPEILNERATLKARMNADKARCEEIETQIKFLMRDAAVLKGVPGWRITWKTRLVQGYTVETKERRQLQILDYRDKA